MTALPRKTALEGSLGAVSAKQAISCLWTIRLAPASIVYLRNCLPGRWQCDLTWEFYNGSVKSPTHVNTHCSRSGTDMSSDKTHHQTPPSPANLLFFPDNWEIRGHSKTVTNPSSGLPSQSLLVVGACALTGPATWWHRALHTICCLGRFPKLYLFTPINPFPISSQVDGSCACLRWQGRLFVDALARLPQTCVCQGQRIYRGSYADTLLKSGDSWRAWKLFKTLTALFSLRHWCWTQNEASVPMITCLGLNFVVALAKQRGLA